MTFRETHEQAATHMRFPPVDMVEGATFSQSHLRRLAGNSIRVTSLEAGAHGTSVTFSVSDIIAALREDPLRRNEMQYWQGYLNKVHYGLPKELQTDPLLTVPLNEGEGE